MECNTYHFQPYCYGISPRLASLSDSGPKSSAGNSSPKNPQQPIPAQLSRNKHICFPFLFSFFPVSFFKERKCSSNLAGGGGRGAWNFHRSASRPSNVHELPKFELSLPLETHAAINGWRSTSTFENWTLNCA